MTTLKLLEISFDGKLTNLAQESRTGGRFSTILLALAKKPYADLLAAAPTMLAAFDRIIAATTPANIQRMIDTGKLPDLLDGIRCVAIDTAKAAGCKVRNEEPESIIEAVEAMLAKKD